MKLSASHSARCQNFRGEHLTKWSVYWWIRLVSYLLIITSDYALSNSSRIISISLICFPHMSHPSMYGYNYLRHLMNHSIYYVYSINQTACSYFIYHLVKLYIYIYIYIYISKKSIYIYTYTYILYIIYTWSWYVYVYVYEPFLLQVAEHYYLPTENFEAAHTVFLTKNRPQLGKISLLFLLI